MIGAFIAALGAVMVTVAFSTPGDQLALSFVGGLLVGYGIVRMVTG